MSARGRSRRRSRPKSEPASEHPLRLGRRDWLVCAGLAVGIAAIYAPVATHGFVNWDDPEYVTNNPMVLRGMTLPGLWWAFTTTHAANWHPVTWLSHMVDVQLFGLQAGWHHIVSVLLHTASSLLLFGWLRRTTGALGRSAVVAALFAVHPTHVESVAWVAERKDALSTVFLMMSLWTYTEYVRRPSRWRYLAVFVSVALGLMAKPMLVTLPFVLLLVDIWPLQRFSLGRPRGGEQPGFQRLVMEKVPLFALAIASAVATFVAQSRGGAVARFDAYPFGLRAVNALISYVAYIGQAFWPVRLAVVYPPRPVPAVLTVAAALAALVLTTALVIRSATRRPYALVGWFWYLGTLVPVIGLVQVGSQPMADRYTYVPLIGLFIILSWGAHDVFAARAAWQRVPAFAAAIGIIACGILTRTQVGYWRDDLTLWTHALALTGKNSRAHNNLANALSDRHDVAGAISHYREAIKIKPDFGEAHSNLANSLAGQGMVDEAEREYEAALRYRPTDPFAHNGLGSLLDEQGKLAEAIGHYEAALRTAPDMADVHNNLAVALTKQGRLDDAVTEFLEAIRANPGGASFHYNLAVTLIQRGDSVQARRHLESALELNPRFEAARQALGALASKR